MKKRQMHIGWLFLIMMLFTELHQIWAADTSSIFVSIQKKEGYFQTKIDLSAENADRRAAGREYGKEIIRQVPEFESLIDSYLLEMQTLLSKVVSKEELFVRVDKIWPNVPQIVRDEIGGIAESACSGASNVLGDGKLSPAELKLYNLIADVFRATQCSVVGVLPAASQTGNVITARNVDWDDGSKFQFARLQSVTTYKLPNQRSLTLVGYLGIVGALTGFSTNVEIDSAGKSTNRLYFAILDSEIGKPYSADQKRSYPSDLRIYAEQATSMEQLVGLLKSTATQYTYGHLIYLADNHTLGVYENSLSYGKSALRTVKDNDNLYMPWKINGVLATVNCFMLKTSFDNASVPSEGNADAGSVRLAKEDAPGDSNVMRWASMQRILSAKSSPYSLDDLKDVEAYGPGKTSEGFIFRYDTQQIVLFEPKTGYLEVAFHPTTRPWSKGEKPVFQRISLDE